jgi:DNA-binding LytR/AlgR family response regulator
VDTLKLIGYEQPVEVGSILWLEGEANYTRVHFLNGTNLIVAVSLYWFEYQLDFVRIHRSAIVNPQYVVEFKYKRGRSGWVRLQNDRQLPVARARLELTAQRLGDELRIKREELLRQ